MDLRTQRTLSSIENAFIDLTLTEGFSKVTVRQIAAEARINPKTFYDHFHNKTALAAYLTQKFLNQYAQLIQTRLENNQDILAGHLDLHLQGLLSSIIDNQKLKKTILALESIHSNSLDFEAQFLQVVSENLNKYHISKDPLTIDIIATITLKIINYYIRTNEPFSLSRQENIVKTLERIINPSR
ncbi:TetR/AcrR family transcriptional regulator [Secundilactobacillus folii]|nr:TetR/AcrR family transcriptional regulator [Secundilactobacillus folii]